MALTRINPNLFTDNSISTAKLADSAVTTAKIANSTILGADMSFPGVTYQIKTGFYNTQMSFSAGVMYDLNCTVIITPTTNNSKFMIFGYGHADDTSSTSWGIGLAITCSASGYTERYYSHQGSHHTYASGANDHYNHANIQEVDDGTGHEGGNIPIVAGVARTYKLWGCSHNDSCRWNPSSISQNTATLSRSPNSTTTYGSRLVIVEFAG